MSAPIHANRVFNLSFVTNIKHNARPGPVIIQTNKDCDSIKSKHRCVCPWMDGSRAMQDACMDVSGRTTQEDKVEQLPRMHVKNCREEHEIRIKV